MKINKHIYTIAFTIGLLSTISCTEGFEELNQDPNSFDKAPPENLFAGVVKNTLDLVGGVMNDQMYLNYASYLGGKGGQFPRYFFTPSLNGYWDRFYVSILKNNQEIIDNFGDNPEYNNRVHIARIWKAYVYSVLVSTFGPVPYEDALQANTTVGYSSEEYIYTEILDLLKDAGTGITLDGDQLLQDPIFNGDNAMWIKFANSLRLKIALRINNGFPSLAQQHGTEAMADEADLISSNAENISMQWGTQQENWSFNYARYVFGDPSPDVVPYANFHFILNLKSYDDPRLPALIDPGSGLIIQDTLLASGSTTNSVVVRYEAPYFGRTLAGTRPLDAWGLDGNDNILNGLDVTSFSQPDSERFFAQDMKYYIITFAEMNFIKAEAKLLGWGGASSVEDYYYAGIDASFEQLEVVGAAEYKEQDGIKWGTESQGDRDIFGVVSSGISADPLDKIVRQRWIALYHHGHDAWCLQKRTRLLPVIPHFAPDGSVDGTYVQIPERMVYALTESGINAEGYSNAVSMLGGDNLYTPLKINKEYQSIDWAGLSAEYNQEFASDWYGNSVDDLIAAGVNYEIVE